MSTASSTDEDTAPSGPMRGPTRGQIEAKIRALHAQAGGLSRVHRTHAALYAQARRAFGSWRAAVLASGLDYRNEIDRSLAHGLERRDERRRLATAVQRFLADHPGATDAVLAVKRPDLARRVAACWGGLERARAWLERARP